MIPSHTRRPRRARVRRTGVALLAGLTLVALAAAVAGCGSSTSGASAAGAAPTSIQVMATATRGDLTQSAMGVARLTKAGAKPVAVATIAAQGASSVAEGQTATAFFFRGGSFPRFGQGGSPRPQASGLPQAGQSGFPVPQGGASGAPFGQSGQAFQGGQGGQAFQGGQGGFFGAQGARGGTAGTVTAVTTNADGTASATISLDKLPSGAKVGSSGFVRIEVKVLASNVILIPTAAVKGSGSSATVQVSANGQTETRTITVGQESGGMTEVVSGLSAGENVLYTRSFRGFPRAGRSGAPFPQGGQSGFGQSGFGQSSGQSSGGF